MRTTTSIMLLALPLGVCLGAPERAGAQQLDDPWYLTLQAGIGGELHDDIDEIGDEYGLGGDAVLGFYGAIIPEIAIGAQVLGGALSEGDVDLQDGREGILDYGMFGVSLRVQPFTRLMGWDNLASGLWLGASPGVAIVDGDAMPAYTASLGFNFPAGPVSIGPMFRFTHFVEIGEQRPRGDVFMWTGGLEIALFDSVQYAAPEPALPVAHAPPLPDLEEPVARIPDEVEIEVEPIEPEVEIEIEEPVVVEREPEVEIEAEEPELVEREPVVNDDISLEQRVYFDFDETAIRDTATDELDAVVEHYRDHAGGYERLIVTGHADDRGSIPYNDALSAARALAVTNYLVSRGVPLEVIDVQAFSELCPLVPGADEPLTHQLNRRVEFTVVWRPGARPEGIEPEHELQMPEYVDAAPLRVRVRETELAAAPRGTSRADRLLAQQERQLQELVGERVTVAMLDRADEDAPRTIAIRTEAAAAAAG